MVLIGILWWGVGGEVNEGAIIIHQLVPLVNHRALASIGIHTRADNKWPLCGFGLIIERSGGGEGGLLLLWLGVVGGVLLLRMALLA